MHIIFHSITHKRQPDVELGQEPEDDGVESMVDGEERAEDPSFVQVTDKEIAMSPRIFCDAECNPMTQWNETGHQQNTRTRRQNISECGRA